MSLPRTSLISCFLLPLLFSSGCTRDSGAGAGNGLNRADPPSGMKVIGYVYGSENSDIEAIDPTRLTHINYAFANIRNHEAVLEQGHDRDLLDRLVRLKEKNPALRILVSVGGWAWSGEFSDTALLPENRDIFARSVARMVEEYRLDGIDLDWEYPGQPGAGNVHRPEDKENFTLLLQEVRRELDELGRKRGRTGNDSYLLTIATGANQNYLDRTEMEKAHQFLDFINIMTYDFHGSWTPVTGHHTNLFASRSGPAETSSHAGVERHIRAGIPVEKLVLGVAFYGRGWTGVDPSGQGLGQAYEENLPALGFSELRKGYINRNGYHRFWDEEAKAPWLWNEETRSFYTYEDEESLRHKAAYVRQTGLGGIMYWQNDHDPDGILLEVLRRELLESSDGVPGRGFTSAGD